MKNSRKFFDKLANGQFCLGTCISLTDPSVVEAICTDFDFLWIDTEHSSISLEALKCHFMAMKGSDCAALVRVPWNDSVQIKPVLDLGADGIIVPMVRTAKDVAEAVSACQYPPDGIRGFGPMRPIDYGRIDVQEFYREANDSIITIVQIEHEDAVRNIQDILEVPGLTSIVFGPQDLSASMGYRGQTRHPKVLQAIETVIEKARKANVPTGISVGDDPDILCQWVDMGIQWLSMSGDIGLLMRAAGEVAGKVRQHLQNVKA